MVSKRSLSEGGAARGQGPFTAIISMVMSNNYYITSQIDLLSKVFGYSWLSYG